MSELKQTKEEEQIVEKSTTKMSELEAELIDKWIYVLLATNDNEAIKGRTRFMSEFFLMTIENVAEVFKAAQFYPYLFGPYSTRVAFRMNILKKEKKIIATYKSTDWQYSLDPKELEKALSIFRTLDSNLLQKIVNIKNSNRRLHLKTLLSNLSHSYSKYTSRTIIKLKEEV